MKDANGWNNRDQVNKLGVEDNAKLKEGCCLMENL